MRKKIIAVIFCILAVLLIVPSFVFAETTETTETIVSTETTASTEAIQTPLEIIKQPTDARGQVGDTVSASVEATGEELEYLWYVKAAGDAEFLASTITENVYSCVLKNAEFKLELYCVITDAYGNCVTSATVKLSPSLPLKILKQPKKSNTPVGETVTVTVKAQGEKVSYRWYEKLPGKKSFQKTSVTTASYSWKAAKKTSGRQVYCVIVDAYGNQVKTKTVTLTCFVPLKITKQPTHVGVKAGKISKTTVTATGEGLKYQWYYKNPKDKKFKKSSIKSKTYSWTMKTKYSGRQTYCIITDTYGNQVKTNVVTHKIPTKLKVTKQPENGYAKIGKTVKASLSAAGDSLSYRWYIQYPGDTKFQKTSITKKTYSAKMSEKMIGAQAYCLITDMFGNKTKSKVISFAIAHAEFERSLYKVKPGATKTLDLLLKPADTVDEIVWKSSNTKIAKVNAKGVVTGVKNGTVTITATGKTTGFRATCTVKVCNVKQVAITFDDGPGKYTAELLTFLKENDIRVTFFLVGNRINTYKNTVKRMVEEGHEVGYHSWKHDIQTKLSNEKIISDYKKSTKIFKSITGTEFTLWRTPGGGRSTRVLNQIALPHIMWSVDTLDWKYRDSSRTNKVIQKNAKDGSIVLLHDIHKSTVKGAMKALEKMQDGDYEFVTVTELLSRKGKTPKPHTTYSRG